MKSNDRYTWRSCIDGYTDTGLYDGITVGDAVCQLADYEDIGLSPDEIKALIFSKEREENARNIIPR